MYYSRQVEQYLTRTADIHRLYKGIQRAVRGQIGRWIKGGRHIKIKWKINDMLIIILALKLAEPWLRRLVAGLSPRRPRLAPGWIHAAFVVDSVVLGQVFLRLLLFSRQYQSTVALQTHRSPNRWTVGPLVAAVQRHSLAPSTRTLKLFFYIIILSKKYVEW
jgi:hypothetical protein